MINKSINIGNVKSNMEQKTNTNDSVAKKPNELGGISITSHLKIYDPNTNHVIVQKRGDI